jgi:ubiquinol-cytochrome c reductase cytochrome c1 subunit
MNKIITLTLVSFLAFAPVAQASDSAHSIDAQEWGFDGPLGTFDRGALQRGFQVYTQVCAACHSMKHLSYRNLSALGYNDAEIKAIAAQYSTMDGPDDEGEMFERPMKPSDKFKNPYDNDNQGRYANNGALPPDLSLITKARVGGADYVYGLLTGYEEPPESEVLASGQHWNNIMPGNKIAMAPPLSDDVVGYEDGSVTTKEQYARDVSTFLTWAAEPEMEERKRTGLKVILFLLAFTGIMYAVKKKIWAGVKH